MKLARGRRVDRECINCEDIFSALAIKIRAGKAKYCSKDCYHEARRNAGKGISRANRQRKWQLKFRYGMTPEEMEFMRTKQSNKCAICRKNFVKTPFVDHCHVSRKIRGLLCSQCNTGLGMFEDNVSRVRDAMEYLQKYN